MIAHHFPPAGTGGVGRALGWARHLPALGWDVTVLAATPTPNWPRDEALTRQIPASVAVHRITSADPRPDAFRGIGHRELSFLWYRPALRKLRSLVRNDPPDVILATSPPPTSPRLAAHMGEEFGIPWVADFRDPWAVRTPGPWCRWRRRVYTRQANACSAVNPVLADHLAVELQRDVTTIYNGFEPDEIPFGVSRVPKRVVFLGTLPSLNTLAPFFKALAMVNGELLHVGVVKPQLSEFAGTQGLARVTSAGYLSRREALQLAASGSAFITALEPGLDLTLPTKVFDYIGLGGPILHLGSHRAIGDFIRDHALGQAVPQDQPDAIAQGLERLWSYHASYSEQLKSRFERKRQAEDTEAMLSGVLKGRAS